MNFDILNLNSRLFVGTKWRSWRFWMG